MQPASRFFLTFVRLLVLDRLVNGAVFTPDIEADLFSYINVSMNCRHIPGMTLTVVKGSEVWSSGFGTAEFSEGKKVDEHILFNIGSVTKSFTASLLGILLKENGFDWSTKVTEVLGPQYQFIDEYRTKELTMRDLLSHRTGLARLDIGLLAGQPHSLPRESLCKNLKYLPSMRPMRDGFIYNNYMYMLLGHVAEVLGKDTWENLLTSRLLEPLGMNNTRILAKPEDVLEPDVARPYIYRGDEFRNGTLEIYDIHPIEPAGAILSTATDMARWIKFNLQSGKTETGTELIDKKLMEEIHWAVTGFDSQEYMRDRFLTMPQYPVDEIQIGYGYAWIVSAYRGYKMIWHSGGLFSYITLVWIYPDKDTGIFASVNGPAFQRLSIRHLTTVFYYISDFLLGLEPWLNETSTCTFPEPWSRRNASQPRELEEPVIVKNLTVYQGSYTHPFLPEAQVSAESNNLLLMFNRIRGILHPSSEEDRFLWEVQYPWEFAVEYTNDNNDTIFTNITFIRNSAGDVNAFKAAFEVELNYTKVGMGHDGANKGVQIAISSGLCLLITIIFLNAYFS